MELKDKLDQLFLMKFAYDNGYAFTNEFADTDIFLHHMFKNILRLNIHGCRFYYYGWSYGIEGGVTAVIMNKAVSEFGAIFHAVAEQNKELADTVMNNLYLEYYGEELERIRYYNNFYIFFGVSKVNHIINRICFRFDLEYSNRHLFTALLLKIIINFYRKMEEETENLKNFLKNRGVFYA